MSYRFVRITDYYPQYLDDFYKRYPKVADLSYDEHHRLITEDSCEAAASYTKEMRKIGIEAFDLLTNSRLLLQTWQIENSLPLSLSPRQTVIAQLKRIQPDVIWLDDLAIADESWIQQLKSEVPSVRLFITHICAPYNHNLVRKFRLFDLVMTCVPCFKSELENLGLKSHLIYHAFDADILSRLNCNVNQKYDLVFSGSLYTGPLFHQSRIEYLEALIDAGISVDLFCNLEPSSTTVLKKTAYVLNRILGETVIKKYSDRFTLLSKIKGYNKPVKGYSKEMKRRSREPVFGLNMLNVLHHSDLCFNMHGEIAGNCSGNIRMFEATGAGTCLLTDAKANLSDLFEPDSEVVTYSGKEECIEKATWLMNHSEKREAIAKSGQQRVLNQHTIAHRTGQLNEIIRAELAK
ncbi:MAG: glycosyltransferase [Bacteroidia bacterium]|nr:glycosyltransferase [Bacteroidia bacterium]